MPNHKEIAHRWAQRSENLRVKGFAMFADGLSIYSWGRHFEIARWVPTEYGNYCVLFNANGYSTSTAGHKSLVRRSISTNVDVFKLPHELWGEDKREEALRYFEAQAAECFAKAKRARDYNKALHLEDAERWLHTAERFAMCFNLLYARPTDSLELAKELAAAQEEAKRIRAEQEAKQHELDRAKFEAWKRGETPYVPQSWSKDANGSVYLRRKDDALETSLGASVPWRQALMVFLQMKTCHDTGEAWRPDFVMTIGHYTVTSINAHGDLTAGCHCISYEEALALATQEGVFAEA